MRFLNTLYKISPMLAIHPQPLPEIFITPLAGSSMGHLLIFTVACWSLVAYQNIFSDPYVSLSLCMHSHIICPRMQRDVCISSTLIFVLLYIIQLFLRNPHGKPRKSQNFTLRGACTLNGRDWCPKAEIGNILRAESRNRNPSCCKLSSFLAIIVDWNSQGHPFIL